MSLSLFVTYYSLHRNTGDLSSRGLLCKLSAHGPQPFCPPILLAPTPASAFANARPIDRCDSWGATPLFNNFNFSLALPNVWFPLDTRWLNTWQLPIHRNPTRVGGEGNKQLFLTRGWLDLILHCWIPLHAHGLPSHIFLSHQNPPGCSGRHTACSAWGSGSKLDYLMAS